MAPSHLRSLLTQSWRDEPISLGALGTHRVRVYAGAAAHGALVLHFHAGAFCGGSVDDGSAVAQALALDGATVASLDYPLAPAHPFPQAIDVGYAALCWLDRRRGARRARLFVAGEEAGGNLAGAVAMMSRDRSGPALDGQILFSPMLDACLATESQRAARHGPPGCFCAEGWRAYLARSADALHPYAALGSSLRCAGLPPTLLVTADDDPMRDETQAFAQRLHDAGVPCRLSRLAMPTGWPRSYLHGDAARWAAAIREPLRDFVARAAAADHEPTEGHQP